MIDITGNSFLQNYTHNLKVVGSNPTPATSKVATKSNSYNNGHPFGGGHFLRLFAKYSQTVCER
tara:strand:+ start:197 stop:388 length:192 start_codon:yes stop_codon:yes gene_type:complete